MAAPKNNCSDEEFIALFRENGAAGAAKLLGINERNAYRRRVSIEERLGVQIQPPKSNSENGIVLPTGQYPQRIPFDYRDGVILLGSDCHYWPGIISTAHRGFCKLGELLQPKAVILNGDVLDGARISRHPPLGWKHAPRLNDEREAVDERLQEIRESSKAKEFFWLLGNHCARFENRLAAQVPEYEGTAGFVLKEHFPHWTFGWSLWINDSLVVKHRFRGGVHATHNNTLWAGKSMATGHLHSLKVTPFSDYNGTRFGIDSGTMANPYDPQFEYTEENPLNWRSGGIVLTFRNGIMLWPEIFAVVDENHIQFRGEVISV